MAGFLEMILYLILNTFIRYNFKYKKGIKVLINQLFSIFDFLIKKKWKSILQLYGNPRTAGVKNDEGRFSLIFLMLFLF